MAEKAEDFARWLQRAIEHGVGSTADKPVVVVGITGKSDASGDSKYVFLDDIIGKSVFCGRYNRNELINIDAYYSEFHQIVFLYLNSYLDSDVQEKLFESDKPFFQLLQDVENLFIEYFFVLFILSHVVVLLQPDTRADVAILRHLLAVNEMRTQRRSQLMERLRRNGELPGIWAEEGRLALPRLLFIFRDNRSRSLQLKTSPDELYNLVDKLERTREFQLVHMMKKCHLAAEHLGIALASLTPHRVPFAYVILPGETETSILNDVLSRMFRGEVTTNQVRATLEQRTAPILPPEKHLNLSKFILGHVTDVIKNDNNLPYFFLLPKLRAFINGARVVMDIATTDEVYSQSSIKSWLSEELHFINDNVDQVVFYAYELYNALIMDDKIGPMFYDPHFNEFRHYRALQHVGAFLKVTLRKTQLDIAWPRVLRQCNQRYKSRHNQCNAKSVSGVRCALLHHKLPAEYTPGQPMDEALRGRSFVHCSGYSYMSTCNCGKTQKRRLDPFTAKEANYDFYSTFTCCSKAEVMPFKLYNPGINWDVSQTRSVVVRRRERARATKKGRGVQLLKREEAAPESAAGTSDNERYSTYTVVKPKSQARVVSELLWQYNQMMHEHKGKYLAHMPHSSTTSSDLAPLFPSWSVLCLGHSKLYVHSKGLSDQPNFVRGAEFLLPWDLNMMVRSDAWDKGMKEILRIDRLSRKERRVDEEAEEKTHKEKLKFFIGFEYECPLGHRFFCEKPEKILNHDKMHGNVSTNAQDLISADLPLYMQCKCSNAEMEVYAQLMRIHVVTPKAPVCAKLNPLVKLDNTGYFHMGQTAELNWGRYYVLRFPFVYDGPAGVISKQHRNGGTLLANCIQIYQKI